jgi:hypothetical protein
MESTEQWSLTLWKRSPGWRTSRYANRPSGVPVDPPQGVRLRLGAGTASSLWLELSEADEPDERSAPPQIYRQTTAAFPRYTFPKTVPNAPSRT